MDCLLAANCVAKKIREQKIYVTREGVSDFAGPLLKAVEKLDNAIQKRNERLRDASQAALLASVVGGLITRATVVVTHEAEYDDQGATTWLCRAYVEPLGAQGEVILGLDLSTQLTINCGCTLPHLIDEIEVLYAYDHGGEQTVEYLITAELAEKLFSNGDYKGFLKAAEVARS